MDDKQNSHRLPEKERILASAQELTLKWVRVNFSSYINNVQERLLATASKAGNNEDQRRYFQAQDEINQYSRAILQLYCRQIQTAFSLYSCLSRKKTSAWLTTASWRKSSPLLL
jgi:hypothetical protein